MAGHFGLPNSPDSERQIEARVRKEPVRTHRLEPISNQDTVLVPKLPFIELTTQVLALAKRLEDRVLQYLVRASFERYRLSVDHERQAHRGSFQRKPALLFGMIRFDFNMRFSRSACSSMFFTV